MELMRTSYFTPAVLALVSFYIIYVFAQRTALARSRRKIQLEHGCLPPPALPQSERVVGLGMFRANIRAFKEHRFLDLVCDRFHSVGANTVQFVSLGRVVTATIEPENLKTIQAVDFKKWALGRRRKTAFQPLLGQGIFTTDGQHWQHSRDMLRPNFTRSQIGDLPTFETHVKNLIGAIPRDGSTVDLMDLFFRLTIDSATEFLFGESTMSLTKDSSEGFAESFTRGQEYISNRSRLGIWAPLFPVNKTWEHDRKFVHDFVDYYVDQALSKRAELLSQKSRTRESGRYIFIEELVRQTTDRVRMRSEALNILLAGRDTTASLLTNVWFVLSKRPDLWTKLQAEVNQLQGQVPSWEQLRNMKFVKALLNESLRIHPVVPANSRDAIEDTVLPLGGGPDGSAPLFVKKGQVVTFSVYAMHRRKDLYGADAEEFKPERWLDDPATGQKGLRTGWEYLPFNGGARICLGQQFALTEASYTTVRMCQAFSGIESRDPAPWREFITLTCVNLGGAKVALTPRQT